MVKIILIIIRTKIVIILMMSFVSAMNTSNGQKVDLKQDLRKIMAAGHFTTIPCEPNTASRQLESHFF